MTSALNNPGNSVEIQGSTIELILKSVLQKRFPGDHERQRVVRRVDRYNICCPFCGDSTQAQKKRGNLYPSTLKYVCYNGGCEKHTDIVWMAEYFKIDGVLSDEEKTSAKIQLQATRETMMQERMRRADLSLEALTNTDFKSILVSRAQFMKDIGLSEIHPKSSMGVYLEKRFQKIDERFAWDQRRKRLFIFNMDRKREWIFAFQTRQFDDGPAKYLTYNLTGMLTKFMGVTDEERLKKAKDLDHVSTVFNIFDINFNETVTMFEGPLDSFLFRNAVGMCSIKNGWPFDTDNYRLFQDNDEAGRKKALELLADGKSVFLWKKLIDDYDLHGKRIKDYNDLVIHQMLNNLKIDNIDGYFSTHRYDGIYL